MEMNKNTDVCRSVMPCSPAKRNFTTMMETRRTSKSSVTFTRIQSATTQKTEEKQSDCYSDVT